MNTQTRNALLSTALFGLTWLAACTALQANTIKTELVDCGETAATSALPGVQQQVENALLTPATTANSASSTTPEEAIEKVAVSAGEDAVVCAIGVLISNGEANLAASVTDGGSLYTIEKTDMAKLITLRSRASVWLAKHHKAPAVKIVKAS